MSFSKRGLMTSAARIVANGGGPGLRAEQKVRITRESNPHPRANPGYWVEGESESGHSERGAVRPGV
jgi:hypothetical protein